MPPRALLIILSIVAVMNFLFAGYFLLKGAWPVTPFMGLDVALLAWAFQASVKASKREEQVTLTQDRLQVVRRAPGKPAGEYCFNPYWVRVQMDESPDHARVFHGAVPQASALTLWSHGKGLTIGGFLSPMVRAEFGNELKAALARLRR
jgi:uncharacterized membrane protein